jgi:hypothetical protein
LYFPLHLDQNALTGRVIPSASYPVLAARTLQAQLICGDRQLTRSSSLPLSTMDLKLETEGLGQAVENIPSKPLAGEDLSAKDKAAVLLQQANEAVIVMPEENARILRKIDLTILPILLAVYFLQGLDKATLSYASVFGLVQDANLGGQDYSWLGSIVYVAQLVLQPVIAYFLVKLPTGKFTAVMVLCWGAVLSFMALARNFQGLMATRFFLGAFEAAVGEFICLS